MLHEPLTAQRDQAKCAPLRRESRVALAADLFARSEAERLHMLEHAIDCREPLDHIWKAHALGAMLAVRTAHALLALVRQQEIVLVGCGDYVHARRAVCRSAIAPTSLASRPTCQLAGRLS